jgi:hypothetical protein
VVPLREHRERNKQRRQQYASWFAIWGLYSAYTWTIDPTSVTVQVVRFYVPAIGAIALLGAWLVTRTPAVHGVPA